MIPKECKRLIEVDFPIAEVSRHSAREKSIRHGHPSTLHLWWARRPLAACRAVLLGLLLPDPCDPHCPEEFKPKARQALQGVANPGTTDEGLRKAVLKFIADFANWDNSDKQAFLRAGRGLVGAAWPDEPPLVVDPFAGGGSIPLEALRVGCDAFASDLNPVACLILKVLLEDIPHHGAELADDLQRMGKQIKNEAEEELAQFYPSDPDGERPVAYIWARTVRCESPQCGAEIPLIRSFWLCTKKNRRRALQARVIRNPSKRPHVELDVFEPEAADEVHGPTVRRARATCLCCGAVLPPKRVRAQLKKQRGGADVEFDQSGNRIGGARLVAVVLRHTAGPGRGYRPACDRDYEAVWRAQIHLSELLHQILPNGMSVLPDEPTPSGGGSGAGRAFSLQNYGMMEWRDLFTRRQALVIAVLAKKIRKSTGLHATDGASQVALALATSRFIDDFSSLCRWMSRGTPGPTFTRQALSVLWDFCETWPFDDASWSFAGSCEWVARAIERAPSLPAGHVEQADARESPLPESSAAVWFTDPPYYDAIPYAELSDFFYVWLKRALPSNPFTTGMYEPTTTTQAPTTTTAAPVEPGYLVPKDLEIVQDETQAYDGRDKDRRFFETALGRAFTEGGRVLGKGGIGSVVFAHKTTEGWEALVSALVEAGWVITASWPLVTERSGRPRAHGSAALATSIHLVGRNRRRNARLGEWQDVYRELPKRVGEWMERLQEEGIRGADLVFACIGPALEIYSRYSKVVDAQDREIPLGGDPEAAEPHQRGYLAYVWEAVGRAALQQILGQAEATARNGFSGALEEDSRLTALFLWTLQSTEARGNGESEGVDEEEVKKGSRKGFSLPFDVVRRFAQPLGIHLDEWEDRVVETEKGIVRLVPVRERAEQLFGADGADAVADEIEARPQGPIQLSFLPAEEEAAPEVRGGRRRRRSGASDEDLTTDSGATTLDRVHAAMLLQAGGRTNALRALLKSEQDRGPEFMRLANALSALYPRGSEEKRLLDAMLLAAPR